MTEQLFNAKSAKKVVLIFNTYQLFFGCSLF